MSKSVTVNFPPDSGLSPRIIDDVLRLDVKDGCFRISALYEGNHRTFYYPFTAVVSVVETQQEARV